MSFEFRDLWIKERSRGFHRLAGSRVSGRVPIRQALVDEGLRRWRKPAGVENVSVTLLAGNLIQLSMQFNVFGFRKGVETTVRMAPAVQLQGRPTLHLFFVRPTFLATVASFLSPLLERGVSVTRDAVALDLRDLLARVRCDDLLAHVRAVALDGQEGVIWLKVEIEVDPSAAPPLDPSASVSIDRAVPAGSEDVTSMFAGTDLAVTLRIEETLATDAIEILFGQMQQPRIDEGPAVARETITRLVGTPRVRFEPQVMVVDTDLRL